MEAILAIRELVDSTSRRYAELTKDETVKAALDALNSKSKTPLKLGPSRGFDDSVKQLVNREKSVLSKAVEMRRRGGVFEIDVTLNGKVTTPMIFDTGASLVTLSSEFAAKIGVQPQASDQTIQLHDATGGITAAKKMTIDHRARRSVHGEKCRLRSLAPGQTRRATLVGSKLHQPVYP